MKRIEVTPNRKWSVVSHWRILVVIGLPLILLPLIFLDNDQAANGHEADADTGTDADKEAGNGNTKFRCAYVLILMSVFWMVEVIPLAMTSFIPIVLFPLLQIQSTETVSMNYMKETNLMFLGGLIVSCAVEYSDLHRRIALRVLTLIGCSPAKIVFGVMTVTMFLSMWMLNSATAAMMCPVVLAVLEELNRDKRSFNDYVIESGHRKISVISIVSDWSERETESVEKNGFGALPTNSVTETQTQEKDGRRRQKQMMLLAVAYAAVIGGTGVVTGATQNIVSLQMIKETDFSQNGEYLDLTFATWMAYAVPPMLINVLIAWMYLTITFLGPPDWLRFKMSREERRARKFEKKKTEQHVHQLLTSEYEKLGPMNFHQFAVTGLYFVVIMLWLFRDPRFVHGWGEYFPNVKIGDSTAAMFIALLLFAVPKDPSFLKCQTPKIPGTLLDWKFVQNKIPWDIFILMGSGVAVSSAANESGLSSWIGSHLDLLKSLDPVVILIIVMLLISSITEFMTATGCANLSVPILLSLSKRLKLHPLYLTLPTAISCSFSFMLPVGTPSNGIVYAVSEGDLTILDMVKTGVFIKIFCTLFHFLIHITYGNLLFNFDNFVYAMPKT